MRFRYFDAEGNEVALATAAALAVKIDLGEVTETTLLYDAACDEWAPAGEQDIYRHILEHGISAAEGGTTEEIEEADDAGASLDPVEGEPDPSRSGARPSGSRPTAPPLEDFWGPAMSASDDEGSGAGAFDLSLEDLSPPPAREASPSADEGPGGTGIPEEDVSAEGSGFRSEGMEEPTVEPAEGTAPPDPLPAEPAPGAGASPAPGTC